jgi:hypothetical protein
MPDLGLEAYIVCHYSRSVEAVAWWSSTRLEIAEGWSRDKGLSSAWVTGEPRRFGHDDEVLRRW